ncbi:MAG TPA: NAD-dependent epimerase/dehydratase family protein [Chitinophagaceae bacterium]|nr:NAD-dependent epimerase/dehydratase family protein [Chitinophagaceae bacterium]
MQTILGAGGAIGKSLATELRAYTNEVRLVGRHPKKVSEADELVAADLTNAAATAAVVEGSEVVYLLAGLPYKLQVWQQQWPVIMQNVIDACKQYNAKLVIFDNIYMYDADHLADMTEETPLNPPSKKGKVRDSIAQKVMNEIGAGNINALIARSADFYGPAVATSLLAETVLKNLKNRKKAQWMADVSKVHSFTYVPDAAKATALLGNTPNAYNQVWHLPTCTQKLTGQDWIALFAKHLHAKPVYTVLSKRMLKVLGIFIPLLRELPEMLYQYDRDYFFNSQKFTQRFPHFQVTPYEEGVEQTVAATNSQQA